MKSKKENPLENKTKKKKSVFRRGTNIDLMNADIAVQMGRPYSTLFPKKREYNNSKYKD